jgi:hypothetical protein
MGIFLKFETIWIEMSLIFIDLLTDGYSIEIVQC